MIKQSVIQLFKYILDSISFTNFIFHEKLDDHILYFYTLTPMILKN